MENKNAYVVLEELMRMAMDEAVALREKHDLTDEEHGEMMAYFKILDAGKQQADIFGMKFIDRELDAFDPYSLIGVRKAA